jgi:hypothetical protein
MRKAGKKKVLGLMATSLKREQAKKARRSKKDSAKTDVTSDEDSDESVHGIERVIDGPIPRKKVARVRTMDYDDSTSEGSQPKKLKSILKEKAGVKHKLESDPTLDEEEAAFLKKVMQAEAEENASDTESNDSE